MAKLPKPILQALDATGLPYETEHRTKGHIKLRLAGRLVGVIDAVGKNDRPGRSQLNLIAQIRRAAAAIKEGRT